MCSSDLTSGPLTLVGTSVADVVFTPAEGDRIFTVTGGSLTLESLTLTGAAPTDGDGGAIAVTGADLVLVGVVASGNSSVSDGGAVSVSSGTLTLDGCTLSDNLAGDDGGAVAVVSSTIEDRGSTWSGNTASQGGGLLAVSSGVTLDTSIFIDGTATTDGGGIALDGATPLAIEGVVLSGNTAVRGGGLALNDVDAEGYVRNLLVVGNVADEGGGVAYTGSVAAGILANTTLVGNTSTGDGAALLIDVTDAAGLWVWANVFAWNDGDDGLHAVGGASVDWNLGYATDSGTDFDIDVEGPENLVDDPLFRDFSDNGDPSDDDLTPSAGSPARNSGPTDGAGPAGYTTWADSDGTRNDRGYKIGRAHV